MIKVELILATFIISSTGVVPWLVQPNKIKIALSGTLNQCHALRFKHQYPDHTKHELLMHSGESDNMIVSKKEAWSFQNRYEDNSNKNDILLPYDDVLKKGVHGHIFSVSFNENEKEEYRHVSQGQNKSHYVRPLGFLKVKNNDAQDQRANTNILCLHRHKIWWMRPVFIPPDSFRCPSETLFMLGMNDTKYFRLILPLILPSIDNDGCTSCSLGPSSSLGQVEVRSETGGTVALYCGICTNPFELIQEAVQLGLDYYQSILQNSKDNDNQNKEECHVEMEKLLLPTKRQQLPKIVNGLGWCTWNAFYTQVSGDKIVSAVQDFHTKLETPIRWIIVDDGWQQSTTKILAQDGEQWGERLLSFQAHPDKFPSSYSFKQTIQTLKQRQNIQAILAWHTLPGYWLGVDEKMLLFSPENQDNAKGNGSSLYFPSFPSGIVENDPSALKEHSISKGIRIPNNLSHFYNSYHMYLKNCGIDGVKVDAQAVCGILFPSSNNHDTDSRQRHSIAWQLHNHLARSIIKSFANPSEKHDDTTQDYNVIHCMSHAPEIIYRLPFLYNNNNSNDKRTKVIMRASDDHYPLNPYSRGPHIVDCAFNSLLLGTLTIPDWDMFTTTTGSCNDANGIQMDAISRAISGGPIYVSDAPTTKRHQHHLPFFLKRLVCQNGVVLTCIDYARPIRSCLLQDPLSMNTPLVLQNVNGNPKTQKITSGVLALFHLTNSGTWDYEQLEYVPCLKNTISLQKQTVSLCAEDIDAFCDDTNDVDNLQYGVYSPLTGKLLGILPDSKSKMNFELTPSESNIINIIPLYHHDMFQFIPVGLHKFYNPGGAILDVIMETIPGQNHTQIKMDVKGGGVFRVYFRIDAVKTRLNFDHDIVITINGVIANYTSSTCLIDDCDLKDSTDKDTKSSSHHLLCIDFNVPCISDMRTISTIGISIC